MRIGMNIICETFLCTDTTKKGRPYTRNNCQDQCILQKVL